MKLRSLILSLAIFSTVIACEEANNKKKAETDPEIEVQLKKIDSVVTKFKEHELQDRARINVAFQLINLYKNFANDYPEHDKSPVYLYNAAGLSADPLQNYDETVQLYKQLAENYPEHDKAPFALMSAAFLLENIFERYNDARVLYREFMKRYPDHELYNDVKFAYENVGTIPDDLLKKIERDKLENSLEKVE